MEKLGDKYSTKEGEGKIVLSQDTYTFCEFIEALTLEIEKGRLSK